MDRFTTTTEYSIQGHYGFGWEEVAAETTHSEARERLKEHRENEPGTPFRLRRVAVPVPTVPVWLHFKSAGGVAFVSLRSKRIGVRVLLGSRWRKMLDGVVRGLPGGVGLPEGEFCEVQDMAREHFPSDREAIAAGVAVK